ncbi:hypothetical protein B0H15DRAFT_612520 [Mycena belliarum]|uniref:Uncharacterized protein n=1 Tax=Mycena belliarum TaxID=1033014 RepID=A0AAD6TUV1_9AGAR|nr:hypothetical protein B0H15DRAFT_612520 [Mycena belliae]
MSRCSQNPFACAFHHPFKHLACVVQIWLLSAEQPCFRPVPLAPAYRSCTQRSMSPLRALRLVTPERQGAQNEARSDDVKRGPRRTQASMCAPPRRARRGGRSVAMEGARVVRRGCPGGLARRHRWRKVVSAFTGTHRGVAVAVGANVVLVVVVVVVVVIVVVVTVITEVTEFVHTIWILQPPPHSSQDLPGSTKPVQSVGNPNVACTW